MLRNRPTQHRRRSSAASKAIIQDQNPQPWHSSLQPAAEDNRAPSGFIAESCMANAKKERQTPLESPSSAPESITSAANDMDSLTTSMASLKLVPPSVRFGRGGRKAGLARS